MNSKTICTTANAPYQPRWLSGMLAGCFQTGVSYPAINGWGLWNKTYKPSCLWQSSSDFSSLNFSDKLYSDPPGSFVGEVCLVYLLYLTQHNQATKLPAVVFIPIGYVTSESKQLVQ